MKKSLAEMIGTFFLTFAGTGAIVINAHTQGGIGHVGIALTFGLTVMAMIYAFGDVSGAHLNPAVTLGLLVAGKVSAKQVPAYLAAQCVGALLASVLLHGMFPEDATLGATLPRGSAGQSFILECVLTLVLMLTILNVSRAGKEGAAGLAVGGIIALEALFAGPISGASMNPIRSLAPALVSGHLEHLWVYLTAPLLGAVLAVPLCMGTRESGCCRCC